MHEQWYGDVLVVHEQWCGDEWYVLWYDESLEMFLELFWLLILPS